MKVIIVSSVCNPKHDLINKIIARLDIAAPIEQVEIFILIYLFLDRQNVQSARSAEQPAAAHLTGPKHA